jgi:hypothetical protein
MRLTFTKRTGKHDDLLVERAGHPPATIACPKQGIIPHDMIHYAVEGTLAQRGFLSLVAEGQSVGFMTVGDEAAEAIERLVETFQAEMWGGRVVAEELLATYQHACDAHGHAVAPVSLPDIAAIRARIDELTEQWSATPVGGSLTVEL